MGKPFFKYEFSGYHGCECVCDIAVHENLVVCSSRADNEGTSITNMAERLATDICKQFDIAPHQRIWIEHYREERDRRDRVTRKETFDLVFFNLTGGGFFDEKAKGFEFSKPRWVTITPKVAFALIESHTDTENDEPPDDEYEDGRDFDEPYATEPEDRIYGI